MHAKREVSVVYIKQPRATIRKEFSTPREAHEYAVPWRGQKIRIQRELVGRTE